MSFRDTLNNNSSIFTIGAVVILLIALYFLFANMKGDAAGTRVSGRWYYNTETGKLFADEYDKLTPFDVEGGGTGVLAKIFTCNDSCGGQDLNGKSPDEIESLGLIVSHLQRVTKRGKAQIEEYQKKFSNMNLLQRLDMEQQHAVARKVEEKQWYPLESPEYELITNELRKMCPGKAWPKKCEPTSN